MPYPDDTYEVRVIHGSPRDDSAAVTVCHIGKGLRRDHPSVVGPFFADSNRARFVAAHLTWALRQQGVSVVPALTITDGAALITAIETEIELTMDAWYDDKQFDWGGPLWIDTLRSIDFDDNASGSVTLDPDQALAVADVIVSQLETAEDFDDGEYPELNQPTSERLREYGRQLEDAGFPIYLGGVGRASEGYRIRFTRGTTPLSGPYDVVYGGKMIDNADTLADAWKLIEKHRSPQSEHPEITKDKE